MGGHLGGRITVIDDKARYVDTTNAVMLLGIGLGLFNRATKPDAPPMVVLTMIGELADGIEAEHDYVLDSDGLASLIVQLLQGGHTLMGVDDFQERLTRMYKAHLPS